MTQQTINIGSAANDGTGDPLRTSFVKTNANFTELYAYAAPLDALAYNGMQINGSMDVSQEMGGAITSISTYYICDGWKQVFSGTMLLYGQQVSAPTIYPGYNNVLVCSVATGQASLAAGDFAFISQAIEGYRVARLAWGQASAQPIAIGFWSAHHVTGLYSGSIRNAAANRSYAFTYTQAAVDVPQFNTVTIPGDVTGTWANDNTVGMLLTFSMGAGGTWTAPSANVWSSGNFQAAPGQVNAVVTGGVFRLTGVVVLPGIEVPTAARSPFIMRPFDQELTVCKRYWQSGTFSIQGYGGAAAVSVGSGFSLPVSMRASPTVGFVETSNTGMSTRSITADTPGYLRTNAVAANAFSWTGSFTANARL